MSRTGKLTAVRVRQETRPGKYPDGGNLYLQVAEGGSKSWLFRFKRAGKTRWAGFGSLALVSLAEAREAALEARKALRAGTDPIEARRAARLEEKLTAAGTKRFRECAKGYIAAHEPGWKNQVHAAQWPSSLEAYVYPAIGDLPVSAIDTAMVLKCLEPIWTAKPETAGRVRGRIEAILDWAKARGYRAGENPARWRGHLDKLLAPRRRVQKTKHHAALDYKEVPAFMQELRILEGVSPRALEFVILTATRTGEAIGARWDEVDLQDALWSVPAARMKAGREHRVPLAPQAVELLKTLPRERNNPFVFIGSKEGQPLSNMALLATLRRMGKKVTTHGFRSSFRDWCAEQTNFPREIAEAALAHVVRDKTEAAYQRGDLLEKRRLLMTAWADYLASLRAATQGSSATGSRVSELLPSRELKKPGRGRPRLPVDKDWGAEARTLKFIKGLLKDPETREEYKAALNKEDSLLRPLPQSQDALKQQIKRARKRAREAGDK